MNETELEIIRLKWRVELLQAMIVKLWTTFFSAQTGERPQQSVQRLLTAFDLTQAQTDRLLATYALQGIPEDRRILLAQEYAQVLAEMKTFITSLVMSSSQETGEGTR